MKSLLILFLALALASCAASRHAEPNDLLSMLAPDAPKGTPPSAPPDSLPKEGPSSAQNDRPSFIKRAAAKVVAAVNGSGKSGKIKNSTIIIQHGTGNTAASATKPGTMATGAGATATEVVRSDGVAVGDGSQAASSRKGPAVSGEGNTVSQPAALSNWWKWLLLGTGLGFFGPKLVKRFLWPAPA